MCYSHTSCTLSTLFVSNEDDDDDSPPHVLDPETVTGDGFWHGLVKRQQVLLSSCCCLVSYMRWLLTSFAYRLNWVQPWLAQAPVAPRRKRELIPCTGTHCSRELAFLMVVRRPRQWMRVRDHRVTAPNRRLGRRRSLSDRVKSSRICHRRRVVKARRCRRCGPPCVAPFLRL